jgi:hypothetical protein
MKGHLRHPRGLGTVCGRKRVLVEADPRLVTCRDCLRKAKPAPCLVPLSFVHDCAGRVAAATLALIAKEVRQAKIPEPLPDFASHVQECLRAVIAELQRHVIRDDATTWQTEHAPKTA